MRFLISTIPKSGTHYLVRTLVRVHGFPAYSLDKILLTAMRNSGNDLIHRFLQQFGHDILVSGHFRYHAWPDLVEALGRLNFKGFVAHFAIPQM